MGGWNIEICDCVKNPKTFLCALCVPGGMCCIQMASAMVAQDNKNAWKKVCLLDCFCGYIGFVLNRYELRKTLEIKDSILFDACFWCCVPCCAVTQEFMQALDYKKSQEVTLSVWKVWKDVRSRP